jgi:hypothetical protein
MSIFRDFFVKEKPVFTGITRGVGGFGFGKAAAAGGGAVESTGGTVTEHVNKDGKIYKLHLWTTSTPEADKEFTAGSVLTGDVIVIGGGGAGGDYAGGGGGAGGVLYSASGITINPAPSVAVTIGTGGIANVGPSGSPPLASTPGGDSTIVINGVTLTADGGGVGGDFPGDNAASGGSGGGGSRDARPGKPATQSPAPTPGGNLTGYGNPGIAGQPNIHPQYSAGGGGGAGGVGQSPGSAHAAGPGGVAGEFTRFSRAYLPPSAAPSKFLSATGGGGAYAAGGGGGIEGSVFQAAGGVGGGGMAAGPNVPRPGQAGFSFGSGGGGGAGAYPYPEARGGNGADGAVMVRYETGQVASTTGATASGGNVNGLEPGNGYKYHTFTGNGTLTVSSPGEIEVLIVAAGGSTSSSSACCVGHGGGGGGGILHGGYTISAGTYPVVVGTGGGPGANNGNPSTFDGHTAEGGGFGGRYDGNYRSANNGGSGGGGAATDPSVSQGETEVTGPRQGSVSLSTQNPSPTPGVALSGYGSEGGHGSSRSPGSPQESMVAGGGGGAGGLGHRGTPGPYHSPTNSRDGHGGPGVQFPQFTGTLIGVPSLDPHNGYYGGGGGGGVRNNYPTNGSGGAGGAGGGGNGAPKGNQGADGGTNTGGGAGGPSGGAGGSGTNGGPGIVVIRYKV